jgi:hypothetical protein
MIGLMLVILLAAEPATAVTRPTGSREKYERHRARAAKYAPKPRAAQLRKKPKKLKAVEIRWGKPDPAASARKR